MTEKIFVEHPLLTPIDLTPIYNRTISKLQPEDASAKVLAHKDSLLTGAQNLWGIPFKLGANNEQHNLILLKDHAVTLTFEQPLHDPQFIFLHAADFQANPTSPDGIIRPMMGEPRLGETVCEYILNYGDGTEYAVPIRRRYQISEFQVKWGENSFESVKHVKPRTMPSNSDIPQQIPEIPWGQSQLRTTFQGFGSLMHHWLYALDNPYPDKELTSIIMKPVDGTVFLFGITRSQLHSNPFRWETRQKIKYVSDSNQELNLFGVQANIKLDLGEIISVSPVLDYNHDHWLGNSNPRLPVPVKQEWIIEFAAHPEARLTIVRDDGDGYVEGDKCDETGESSGNHLIVQHVPIRDLAALSPFTEMENAYSKVTLRTVERSSGQPVPVKIHLHGAFGEYLAPINGHRLPNAHWFEDYGVEHVQDRHYSAYIDGIAEFKLPHGNVFIEVTKGFEIKPVRKMFTIEDTTNEITIELEHVLPWRQKGWVTADTHVHFLSPQTALLEGQAEGVNVINLLTSQWGEMFSNLGDFDGKTTIGSTENGGSGEYLVRVGTENRQHILGHISLLGYEGRMIVPLCTGGSGRIRPRGCRRSDTHPMGAAVP